MRILLAEDDKQLNDTLTYQLETEGFIVDSCLDGEEALFYGEQNIYDIILLDRMLPHIEGTDVLTSLRKKRNRNTHHPDYGIGYFIRQSDRSGPGRRRLSGQAVCI